MTESPQKQSNSNADSCCAGSDDRERTVILPLEGVRSSQDAHIIEKALSTLDAITHATVDCSDRCLAVTFIPHLLTLEEIISIVERQGFRVGKKETLRGYEAMTQATVQIEKRRRRLLWTGTYAYMMFVIVLFLGLFWKGKLLGYPGPPPFPLKQFVLFEFLITTPVMFVTGMQFYRGAWRGLMRGKISHYFLVSFSTLAAYFWSTYALFFGNPMQEMFMGALVLLAFVTLGEYMTEILTKRMRNSLFELLKLEPTRARLLRDGKEAMVDAQELQVGDIVLVKPGEQIPSDGKVVEGESAVNEAMVTGESVPVMRRVGDDVIGGTLNDESILRVEITKVGKETTLRKIAQLLDRAQLSKPPIQILVDKISTIYVPIIFVLGLITLGVWIFVFQNVPQGIFAMAAMYIVACPCALGLATPTAAIVGTGRGAKNYILFKQAAFVEKLQEIDTAVFDKTGTLTRGNMQVTDVIAAGGGEGQTCLLLAARVEKGSLHPIARAIVRKAQDEGMSVEGMKDFLETKGKGVQGAVDGKNVLVGNKSFMEQHQLYPSPLIAEHDRLSREGKTVLFVACNGMLQGMVAVRDELRENAYHSIDAMKKRGIQTIMLTGDHAIVGEAIGKELGMDHIHSQVLPEDKVRILEDLQEGGRTVLMIGDGINDGPALAIADIGIAIGGGTDVALEASDVTLMREDPWDAEIALRMSEFTTRKIKQNLFISFYEASALTILAGLGLLILPVAALLMLGSILLVIGNSLLLERADVRRQKVNTLLDIFTPFHSKAPFHG